ncbi:hypothetical protein Trydic_g16247 [Trypoxylus dichotomus]
MSKIADRIILARLREETDDLDVIPDCQFGFRREHSTTHQVLHFVEHRRECTGAVFLDVAKAFDKVWHQGLLLKMHRAGISKAIVKLVHSFLRKRTFQVKLEGRRSTTRTATAGVPQRSAISSLLFNIYTSDIPTTAHVNLAMYADDVCIYSRSLNARVIDRRLQTALDTLRDWYAKWRIAVHPQKSTAVLFAIGVWATASPTHIRKLEAVQSPALRSALNAPCMVFLSLVAIFLTYTLDQYVLSVKPLNFSTKRIVKGFECSPRDYPYLVSIVTDRQAHYCGGSLLSKNLVLTAGHCCDYEGYFQVWTGLTQARTYAQTSYVSKRFIHPNYTTDPLSTDLCVLQLSTDIAENDYTKYVPIVNISVFKAWNDNKDCLTSVAMGFGYQGVKYENDTPKDPNAPYNPVMQCVELSIITPEICDLGMDDSMFCAIDPLSEGRDPCQGDSGGPLICKNVQIGIISAGFGCGIEGYASIYTRVDLFRDYLNTMILRNNAEIFLTERRLLGESRTGLVVVARWYCPAGHSLEVPGMYPYSKKVQQQFIRKLR